MEGLQAFERDGGADVEEVVVEGGDGEPVVAGGWSGSAEGEAVNECGHAVGGGWVDGDEEGEGLIGGPGVGEGDEEVDAIAAEGFEAGEHGVGGEAGHGDALIGVGGEGYVRVGEELIDEGFDGAGVDFGDVEAGGEDGLVVEVGGDGGRGGGGGGGLGGEGGGEEGGGEQGEEVAAG